MGGVTNEIFQQLLRKGTHYDLILTDSAEYVPVSWVISKLLKKPLLVRVRGDIWAEIHQKEKRGVHSMVGVKHFLRLYEYLLKRCQAVIPVSQYLADRIHERISIKKDKIFVIPISVDPMRFARKAPTDTFHNLDVKDREIMLTVTNFRFPDKVALLEEFFPALARIMHIYPKTVFCIAGSGPYLKTFQERIKNVIRPLSQRIHFLSYVKNMESLYSIAKIFVYFSHLDALPRVILEAQASGLPIIANPFGGVRELIRHGQTGFFVNSEEELFQSAKRIFEDDRLRENLGKQAREFVDENYSPQAIGSLWIKVLKQIQSE